MGLLDLANWLCGCSHRRTTLPLTKDNETYVVCLDCGKQFKYDWAKMRTAMREPLHHSSSDQPHDRIEDQSGRGKP